MEYDSSENQPAPHRCWFAMGDRARAQEQQSIAEAMRGMPIRVESNLQNLPRYFPRSPTSVSASVLVPWVKQLALEDGGGERVEGELLIKRIAAHAEADLSARIDLMDHRTGRRIELPLAYLSHLWPQSMPLETAVMVERNAPVDVEVHGCKALVVLFGVRQ